MTSQSAGGKGAERLIVIERFIWNGIAISVNYEADWLGMGVKDCPSPSAHLQIHSFSPQDAPLPITETGYRSRFLARELVEDAGGLVAYVRAWLADAAKSTMWRQAENQRSQLDLFI